MSIAAQVDAAIHWLNLPRAIRGTTIERVDRALFAAASRGYHPDEKRLADIVDHVAKLTALDYRAGTMETVVLPVRELPKRATLSMAEMSCWAEGAE